jgi:DNA-3-methyladenine glycosylase I
MPPKTRCWWCGDDPLYVAYHDEEWGVPLHNDQKLFEMLVLEGFQAGLSWITILRKRQNFRKAFRGFDPAKIARFTKRDLERLMNDPGIVRNRLKVEGSVLNARAYLAILDEGLTFDDFLWQFTGHQTLRRKEATRESLPNRTEESDKMSKELLQRGFKFTGSTICYAFMQAVGMVDDHVETCWKYRKRPPSLNQR